MKIEYPLLSIVKSCVIFLAACSMVSSCTVIDELGTKSDSIEHTNNPYKKLFQQKTYGDFLFDFVTDKDQLILGNMDSIEVVDLPTEARVNHWKNPEDNNWVKSIQVSKDQTKLYISTQDLLQFWDTADWQLLKELKADKYANEVTRLSNDEMLLFFAGYLWETKAFNAILEVGSGRAPTGGAVSPDHRFLVDADYTIGAAVMDIEKREWSGITYFKKGILQVDFRDSTSFFASYGERFDPVSSSYFSAALGVFSAVEEDQLELFLPHDKITCWTHDPDYGVLVSLYDGDIYLLNDNLDIRHKWHMDDFARTCTLTKSGEIWLGGEKTGLYRADLKNRQITHEYQTEGPVHNLKVSGNGRYIGFVEKPSAESVITIITPVTR